MYLFIGYRFTYTQNKVVPKRQKAQCGGGGIMIWGMIMPNGLVTIKKLEGKQNTEKYLDMLRCFAVPLMNLNMQSNYNFVQDNCSIHVSKVAKTFLGEQCFQTLEWPSRSPDINIMENIWKIISDLVYEGNQPQNLKKLEENIIKAIWTINNEKLQTTKKLYDSFRQRLTKILVAKGNIC